MAFAKSSLALANILDFYSLVRSFEQSLKQNYQRILVLSKFLTRV